MGEDHWFLAIFGEFLVIFKDAALGRHIDPIW